MKTILVTGGTGFLGRHVVRRLVNERVNVYAPRHKQYDLLHMEDCVRLALDFQPDTIIHLAATVGGIGANMRQPGRFFFENAIMGIQLMEAARLAGVRKFVTVGTVCAYPKDTPVPFKEDDLWAGFPEPTNAPYGIAKRMLQTMGEAYRAQYRLTTVFLLPVNLYGPGDNDDPESSHVIPALIRRFMAAKLDAAPVVTVWGTGNATREFLYAPDAAEGIAKASLEYDGPLPVNLGTGQEISVKALAHMIAQLVGYQGRVEFDPSKPDGQPRRCLDTQRAETLFGWKARTSLVDGLKETIAAMGGGGPA